MELFDTIHNHAIAAPDRPALLDDETRVTWGEIEEIVDRTALGLVHAGMRRGRGVAVLAGRSVQSAVGILSVIRGGGMAIPLPARLGPDSLRRILRLSEPVLLLYDPRQEKVAEDLARGYAFRETVRLGSPSNGELSLDSLQDTGISGARFPVLSDSAPVLQNFSLDRIGDLCAATGSLVSIWAAATIAIRGLKIRDGARLTTLFSTGLDAHESLLRAVRVGGTAVFCRRLSPQAVCASLTENEVDVLTAPVAYYHMLCDYLEESGGTLEQLRLLEARGHVPAGLRQRVRRVLGQDLIGTWSSVETFGPAIGNIPSGFGAPASPLQAFPGVQDRIVNDQGMEILGESIGELTIHSEQIAQKTRRASGETEECCDADGWFHTGLRSRRHASGEVQILGTRYDVILRCGRRVYPRAVADAAENYPGIAEAVGVLLEGGAGQFELVLAVLLDSEAGYEQHRLMERLASTLATEELPDDVVVLEAIPRRITGDVDGPRLKKLIDEVRFR